MAKNKSNKIFTVAECWVPAELKDYIAQSVAELRNGKEWTKERLEQVEGLTWRQRDFLESVRFHINNGVQMPIVTFGDKTEQRLPVNMLGSAQPYFNEVECISMTVQTMVPALCGARTKKMADIVKETCKSYDSDFRIWDMHTLCRCTRDVHFIWAVGSAGTYIETYQPKDKAAQAVDVFEEKKDTRSIEIFTSQKDNSWMGTALEVAITETSHRCFYWNGTQLIEVDRKCIANLHRQFREYTGHECRYLLSQRGLEAEFNDIKRAA